MSDTTTLEVIEPAPVVPDAELPALIQAVGAAVVGEVGADPARDADRLDLAVHGGIEAVRNYLDRLTPYTSMAAMPYLVFTAMRNLAALYLRRPGYAFGTAGYDPADVDALRAEGAILATIAAYKRRIGVA